MDRSKRSNFDPKGVAEEGETKGLGRGRAPCASRSESERICAARRAPVERHELVRRSDQIEDALHVGPEVEAGNRNACNADAGGEITDGEAGVVHDAVSGVARQAVADPVEAVRGRELEDRREIRDDLAELRIPLLDEEDVAVPVVHDRLPDGIAAEDTGRAEAARDAGNDFEPGIDLHEREVL